MSVGVAIPWGSTDPWEAVFTTGELQARAKDGRVRLPDDHVWAWSAEEVALSHWGGLPAAMTGGMRGWCGGGSVATVGYGRTYLHSISRWSDEPPDPTWDAPTRAAWSAEWGELLEAGCRVLGLPPKGSPGSAARTLLERQVGAKVWASSWRRPRLDMQEFGELALFGGRNEAFWTGNVTQAVSQWDRSSAYVAHLAEPLPAPGTEQWTARPNWKRPGLVHALVIEDPSATGAGPVPVLPAKVRTPEGFRTVFSWGSKVGVWTTAELRAALDRGARLVRTWRCMEWTAAGFGPLGQLAQWVWTKRQQFAWAKRVGVALVGKLHQSRVSRRVVPIEAGELTDLRELLAGWHPGTFVIPRLRPDGVDLALVLQRDERHAWHSVPGLAAWILSRARLELLRAIEANWGRLLCVATDGIMLRGQAEPAGITLGRELGEWRPDVQGRGAVIRGPLHYMIEGPKGKPAVKVRAAGIARTRANAYLSGETIRWESRVRLTERVGAGAWRKRTATAKDVATGRGRAPFRARELEGSPQLLASEAVWTDVREEIDRETGERVLRTFVLSARQTAQVE